MRISVNGVSPVNLGRPDLRNKIRRRIRNCLKEFPKCCEGQIELAGVDHYFVYRVDDDVVEVSLAPREVAEQVLNTIGLSTHEPFNPLPNEMRGRR
jgi:hypothetical protein